MNTSRPIVVSGTILTLILCVTFPAASGQALTPLEVEAALHPNEYIEVDKIVSTPPIPPLVEICLLEDETGSFADDIYNLQSGTTASDIFDAVVAQSPDARFAVAGFRDYPVYPHGGGSDWPYRLLSSMSDNKADWLNGIAGLTAGGGYDGPESQYDAIVSAVDGSLGDPCGFGTDPVLTKVLLVTTDAPFHLPGSGKPHVNTAASTLAVLSAAGVTVVGLKAGGAGTELDYLASETGGSVQPLSSDGADIAAAILAGLGNLAVDVEMVSDCVPPIETIFSPPQTVTSGDDAVFSELIRATNDALPGFYECRDWALINGDPLSDPDTGEIIYETKTITVLDGFMTGGGSVYGADGEKVSHGFELHCASAILPNNLQVNWGKGNKFHLMNLDTATCSDDSVLNEYPPDAGFDTFTGTGTGRYNGEPGATIVFRFTDEGEPGKEDACSIKIIDAALNVVLNVSGKLQNGNHQAKPE